MNTSYMKHVTYFMHAGNVNSLTPAKLCVHAAMQLV